jgi:hypothetical protein
LYSSNNVLSDFVIQSDFKSAFLSFAIKIIFSSFVFAFLLIIGDSIESSLSHLFEMNTFSHSIEIFFRWNRELKILSKSFSPNISNSWNHP